jgi:NADH-quinone oxidoreductase subunit J
MEQFIFYPLSLLCIVFAIGVIVNKSPINSAVSLIGMMLGMAGLFVLLHAHLMAILQVLVYAGAIMVLFMFVIMLLNLKDEENENWKMRGRNFLLTSLSSVIVGILTFKVIGDGFDASIGKPATLPDTFGTTASVGELLFTDFVLPFEVASILLLVAMIGAVVLAKTKLN